MWTPILERLLDPNPETRASAIEILIAMGGKPSYKSQSIKDFLTEKDLVTIG